MTTEYDRLALLAQHAHVMLDALEVLTFDEILEIRTEAEAMTPDQVETMLIQIELDDPGEWAAVRAELAA